MAEDPWFPHFIPRPGIAGPLVGSGGSVPQVIRTVDEPRLPPRTVDYGPGPPFVIASGEAHTASVDLPAEARAARAAVHEEEPEPKKPARKK